MPCDGCADIIKKLILKKNEKLEIETNRKINSVTVNGDITVEEILKILNKWSDQSKNEVKYIPIL
jgi:hypothetical protein